ncbi:MAG: type II toxin-antitoxin system RelE/ParE family toxin [bacterium]|nr:type II toxin-antitoxin system RelE/ParE family toxin [bacterium]
MKVRWMPLALGQVQEIVDYIKQDKPEAAGRWADAVFDLVEGLAAFPKKGRVIPEAGREEIRELFHGDYRIIYRLDEELISILSVRHGYRLLDPEEVLK